MITRRRLMAATAALALGGAAWRYWPEDGWLNPCPEGPLPPEWFDHPLLRSAWDGIDPSQFRDGHVHLIGTGSSGSGLWVNPNMESLAHPVQWLQRAFYLNASCTADSGGDDRQYVERLAALAGQFPQGARFLLLAFDYFHGEDGERRPEASAFHTPDRYAASVARRHPDRFEWIASIHPYRPDAVEALREAARNGARAVKWLPPAQGMDPASPLCDPFYEAAASLDMPLLVHAGAELAVHGANTEDFGNPLRLRRPLDHGLRVLVAHCASLGSGVDLDHGSEGPMVPSFELFARLMDEPRYEGMLFGDISALTQLNRVGNGLAEVVRRRDWHPRLVNGSDYPLPGILPLFSLKQIGRRGYLPDDAFEPLSAIRPWNPLLFDFLLKRNLVIDGARLGPEPFQARAFFDRRHSS